MDDIFFVRGGNPNHVPENIDHALTGQKIRGGELEMHNAQHGGFKMHADLIRIGVPCAHGRSRVPISMARTKKLGSLD